MNLYFVLFKDIALKKKLLKAKKLILPNYEIVLFLFNAQGRVEHSII